MNFIDIIICIPIIWGIYKGVTDGIVTQLAGIVAFFGGIWVASHFSSDFNKLFSFAGKYASIVSFSVFFLVAVILVFLIAKLTNKIVDNASLSTINKMAGAVFGGLKFALMLSVLFFVLDALESSYKQISFQQKKESLLYQPISKIAPLIIPGLKQEKINEILPNSDRKEISALRKHKQQKENE
jgi:membrane protein required for colicin V production